MKLLDEKKFLAEIHPISPTLGKVNIAFTSLGVKKILSKHTKDIIDEPHHPSGLDRDKINTRNDLRKEMRND